MKKIDKAVVGAEASVSAPVEIGGRTYWPTWEEARTHLTHEGGVRVLRWVKRPGTYVTMYC